MDESPSKNCLTLLKMTPTTYAMETNSFEISNGLANSIWVSATWICHAFIRCYLSWTCKFSSEEDEAYIEALEEVKFFEELGFDEQRLLALTFMPNNEKSNCSATLAELLSQPQHGDIMEQIDYQVGSENARIETLLEIVCYNMHKVKSNEIVFQD